MKKANFHFYKHVLAAVLLLLGAQSMQAQEAFYIYRNDGDFNGFFFDQVSRISYSKIDLDSIEHDVYVIQEVETADSLYRIPLASIDSVSFVQPEIKFSPKLKNLAGTAANHFAAPKHGNLHRAATGEAMSDWVTSKSGQFLYFAANTPKNLLPEVGDVLVDYYNPLFKSDEYVADEDYSGFSGKVTDSFEGYNCWVVRTEEVTSLGDIFEQFVTTEEVYYDEKNNIRRRLAGWDDEVSRRAGGGGAASLVDFEGTLKHDFEVGSAKIGVEVGVGMKVRMAATYNISATNLFIKAIVREDFKMQGSVSGKFDSDEEFEITGLPKYLSSIKFPAAAPIFQTRPLPTAFLRVKGEMGAKLDLPEVNFGAKQVIVFDTDNFPMMSASCSMVEPSEDEEPKNPLDNTEVTLYMNGSVQTGIKLTSNVETNDWIDRVFKAGIYADFYLGPQVDGQIELKTSLADLAAGNLPSLYSSMKDSHLSLTGLAANIEVKGKLKVFNDDDDQTFFEVNRKFLESTRYLFPELTGTTAKYDSGSGLISGTVKASRMVFVPSTLGAAIYNTEGTCLDKSFATFNYFLSGKNNEYEYSFKQPCGRYWVRPILKTFGAEIDVDDPLAEREVVVTPILVHGKAEKTDSVTMSADQDKIDITFETNAKQVHIYTMNPDSTLNQVNPDFAFVDEDMDGFTVRKLTVAPGKNTSPLPRQWDLILKAVVGTFESVDTVRVKQDPGNVNFLYVGVDVACPTSGTRHSWGNNAQGPYDITEEWGHANHYVRMPVTSCSRNGNIVTVTGYLDDSNEPYIEDLKEKEWYKKDITERYYNLTLTIDLEKMCVTSGSIQSQYKNTYSLYNGNTAGPTWTITRRTERQSESDVRSSWNEPIPMGSTSLSISSITDYDSNIDYFKVQTLSFKSKNCNGLSMSESETDKAVETLDDIRDGVRHDNSYRYESNVQYSATEDPQEDSCIEIMLIY